MSEREALEQFDRLLDLSADERTRALEQLLLDSPTVGARVAAWLAAEPHDDPRLQRQYYATLIPPAAGEEGGAASGDRIGPYRLVREIGRGGMGSVWLAERVEGDFAQSVALKLIRPDLASPEALPRFKRERQILADLRHPNIAQLLDGGVTPDGRPWLAMEYIEGQSLREMLGRGALPTRRLVALAAQIAAGLAHAHAAGVVHRDLKPDNVLVAREGYAKILDFGVAKLLDDAPAADTMTGTQPGRVIGTTPYMSPEQASGEPVDFRSDQFALGALLYEAATGTSAFARDTPSQTVAAVLRDAPPALEALAATLPAGLMRVMRRCLEKDPAERYASTLDLAHDLAELERGRTAELPAAPATAPVPKRAAPGLPIVIAVAMLATAAAAWWLGQATRGSASPPHGAAALSAEIPIAPAERLNFGAFPLHAFTLSPDGRRLCFGGLREGTRMLYVRALDSRVAQPIPGSEGGANPVFSPDGEWIAYLGNQKLKKVAVGGGSAIVLAEAPNALSGLAWPSADRILFSPTPSVGIWEVSASGGAPRMLTAPDLAAGESSHVWPAVVRGTDIILYAAEIGSADTFDAARIYAFDPKTGRRTLLIDGGSDPRVLGDTLYYARAGTLYAVGFDRSRLALNGSPRPLHQGVVYSPAVGSAQYAIAPGVRVHLAGAHGSDLYEPVIVDLAGNATSIGLAPGGYDRMRISPDGKRAMFQVTAGDDDLWSYDLERRALTRVTDSGENIHPAWTPDGQSIVYSHHDSTAAPAPTLYRRRADGGGAATLLLPQATGIRARLYIDVAPDGKQVAFGQYTIEHNFDIWLLDLESGKAREWVSTPNADMSPRFSPDGRFIAYSSAPPSEGSGQVFVQSLAGDGRRWQITAEGGSVPVWRRDGREIWFVRDSAVYAVALSAGDDLAPGAPRKLFDGDYANRYDAFPDGSGFLMLKRIPEPGRAGPLLIDTY